MRPHIQFAPSGCGSIPCFEFGAGDAIIQMPVPPFSQLEFELALPQLRAWYTILGERHRIVRYDLSGTGVAKHLPPALSFEEQAQTLQAVAEHFGLKRFALLAQFNTTPVAIRFAAEHPESISHLILAHPTTREVGDSPRMRAMRSLLQEDWEMFVETIARARAGWNAGEHAVQMADLIRASASQDVVLRLLAVSESFDLSPYASRLAVPTLVLYRRAADDGDVAGLSRTKFLDAPLELTSRIPGAVLSFVPADAAPPYLGDPADVAEIISRFMLRPPPAAPLVSLSEREREVLMLLSAGASNSDIAEALVLSLSTVKSHVQSIYGKLCVHSRTQALAQARTMGLIP